MRTPTPSRFPAHFGSHIRAACLASAVCAATVSLVGTLEAASFSEFVDPNPAAGNQFGLTAVALSTGKVVITSPYDDANGVDAGAVYLFDGATGALISTLKGSTAGDQIGSGGVIALTNGNYVVRSLSWHNGAFANAGAVTWGSGTTGVAGVVSAANSLVGSKASDVVGGAVLPLSNGNYVIGSPLWDNGAVADAGAATWGSGTSGVSGTVSAANSLVGSTASDNVGSGGTALTNGNYVVASVSWDNGAVANAGAVTWGNGTIGTVGVVSAANSLVGSTANDNVGGNGVTALTNGNYVVSSSYWDNGAVVDAGAATWGSGTTGVAGAITAANSMVGTTASDNVSGSGVTALTNGNYVVSSVLWHNVALASVGAVRWGDGATGAIGAVSAANSLVGSTDVDQIGNYGVTVLSNGNYVVSSPIWDDGAVVDAGAATWGNGTTGIAGVVSASNSLLGAAVNDYVGIAVTALSNGNYVVQSPEWDSGGIGNAGAVTWGSGTTGVSGAVSVANSLVGSTVDDYAGIDGVRALTNGNYVVLSSSWDNGGIVDAGAATWGSGTAGVIGAISAAASLVGSATGDYVGNAGATALSNGNYVVLSPYWRNGGSPNAGAATWGSGTTGVSGVVSAANSLVGSSAFDAVGNAATALSNGNYVVAARDWDNGANLNAGAATWGGGTTGVTGVVSAANSLVGSAAGDNVGSSVTALSNGNYVVRSTTWVNGALGNAGAATWGSGTTGIAGVVSSAISLVGQAPNTNLGAIVADNVNSTFLARFLTEDGGRVRVGPVFDSPVIVSLVDIPDDQGGWVRLTFTRSDRDQVTASPPAATYGVWRHVPGTLAELAGRRDPSAAQGSRLEDRAIEAMRAALPAELDVREVDGQLYVSASGSRAAGTFAAFPAGTWALVTSVPAVQQAQYVVEVPTVSNAAPNDYVVTAHTTTPSLWFISAPASGQSVDNLAPAPPAQLAGAYSGGQTNIQWAANGEHDLGGYRLYRGSSAGFTPAIGNRIATPNSTSYGDVGPAGRYYKLSAVDVNGNESGFALLTPGGTTDVADGSRAEFALEGAWPNPARGSGLNVVFALPAATSAQLELLDLAGRRVVTRAVGSLGAGRHTVNLSEGRRVPAGLYWVRLTQGTNWKTTRVAVIE